MNILEKARPENSFRCADGSLLGSVYELENKLCTMSSEAFYHHVNPVRNDFHNWVRDVFQDYELANELLSAKTPAEAAAIVRKHLRKALLAKEEIENAIKNVSTAKTKPARAAVKTKPAKAAPKQLKKPRLKSKKRKPKPKSRKARLGPVGTSQLGKQKAVATAKAANKNKKLNKTNRNKKDKRKSSSGNSNYSNKKHIRRGRTKKRGKRAHKRIKKQVNKWLNWLKIVPEL